MLNGMGFIDKHKSLWHGLWAKCAAMATKIENVVVSQSKKIPAHKLLYNKEAMYVNHLCIFREVGIVHDGKKICAKQENWAKGCLFIAYADDHGKPVY